MFVDKREKTTFYGIHIIVGIITVACFLMNGFMRGGLPLDTTVQERAQFILSHPVMWPLSWCVWMASALGLFMFCAMLAHRCEKGFLRTVGLSCVAMGIAPDLIAEVLYAFVIPKVLQLESGLLTFEILEIIATHLTGFLGNGLYNIGGLLLTAQAIRQGLFEKWVSMWGILAWVLGLCLSASIAVDSIKAAEIFTATSMVLSTFWMLIFAYRVVK